MSTLPNQGHAFPVPFQGRVGDGHGNQQASAQGAVKVALGIWIILLIVLLVRAYLTPYRNSVYPIFANAAREWADGVDIYDESIPRGTLDKFRYVPLIAAAFTLFAAFPDSLGGVLWRICNGAVFLTGIFAFVRTVFPGEARLNPKTVAILAWLLIPLSLGSLNNGQPNSMVVGCLMLATAAILRQRWNWAALCLAVPVLIKVYPLSVVALVLLVQPRLGWRVAALIALGLLLPFALQEPDFVARAYVSWSNQIASDNRHALALHSSYRDFHLLIRLAGLPLDESLYVVLQLAMAGLVAAVVLRGYWLQWPKAHHLRAAFDLGCCWIILFGPATENCTFALLAVTMALAVWEAFQNGQPAWKRWWAVATVSVFVSSALIAITPLGKSASLLLMPLGGLMMFCERLVCFCAPNRLLAKVAEEHLHLPGKPAGVVKNAGHFSSRRTPSPAGKPAGVVSGKIAANPSLCKITISY